jgi:hypothetical protein
MYTKKTLQKFELDKSMKYFPGVSIVHNIKNDETKDLIKVVLNELKKTSFANKLIFLPEDSYHMTLADIITYNLLDDFKSNVVKFDTIDHTDRLICQLLENMDMLLNVNMFVDYIDQNAIFLEPKTVDDRKKLESFRREVFLLLGMKYDTSYKFHISLGYTLKDLEHGDLLELEYVRTKIYPIIKKEDIEIPIPDAELTFFEDMSQFTNCKYGRRK